jgi:hypothetical protein
LETVKVLVERGADLELKENINVRPPFPYFLCSTAQSPFPGASGPYSSPNVKERFTLMISQGNSALLTAAWSNSPSIIAYLVDHAANINATNSQVVPH